MSDITPERIEPALLTIAQVCQVLNVSRAEFYRLDQTGKFGPLSTGLCRKRLYVRAEIENWIRAGLSPSQTMANSTKGNQAMKTRTKTPEKERAACPAQQAAPKNMLPNESYRIVPPPSSLQSEIGTLLLCLQLPVGPELSQIGWALFERLLRRYIDRRTA